MPFALTPEMAKSILYASEGVYGGHTLERHINISNADLQKRYDDGSPNGNVLLYTAFVSVAQAAEALAAAVTHLGQSEEYFRVFPNQGEGEKLIRDKFRINKPFTVRSGRGKGKLETDFFTLWAQKRKDMPSKLHVISFFATLPNVDMSAKGKNDPNSPYI